MKVTIRDATVLAALSPLRIAAYLWSTGWTKVPERADHSSTWLYKDNVGEEFEIVIPLDRAFRDFALRMGDVLHTLEAVEGRSQFELLRDLQEMPANPPSGGSG